MIKAVTETVATIANGLKAQPLALPLVTINVLFLGVVGYVLYEISAHTSARDQLLFELVKECRTGTT